MSLQCYQPVGLITCTLGIVEIFQDPRQQHRGHVRRLCTMQRGGGAEDGRGVGRLEDQTKNLTCLRHAALRVPT